VWRPRGTSGCVDQGGRAGIDADGQNFGARSGEPGYCPTVACAKVEDRSRVTPDQLVDLADVELAQSMANDHAHETRIIAHWRASPEIW